MDKTIQHHQPGAQIIWEKLSNCLTEDQKLVIIGRFKPRPSDVIVMGCCKTGTTWLQQIVHQLRTGGDMEFTEIMEVVPVIELSVWLEQDLDADQKAFPRCFKTHCLYQYRPERAKYIFCLREPCSVVYSAFKMFEGWFFQPGEVSLNDFVREWTAQQDKLPKEISTGLEMSYFHHLTSWWPHRKNPNVLVLFYEDLKESYESSIHTVATFMGITNEKNIQAAQERCTFEYMKRNSDKFDQKLLKQNNSMMYDLPSTAGLEKSKIRTGTTTEGYEMMPVEGRAEIQQKWKEALFPVTGCSTYEELKAKCKAELNCNK